MRPTITQYAQALTELGAGLEPGTVAAEDLSRSFVAYLERVGERENLEAVLRSLERIESGRDGVISVEATLAHPADGATRQALEAKAAGLFPDQRVELSYRIDPELIGGARFRSEEILYDASLSGELGELKKALMR